MEALIVETINSIKDYMPKLIVGCNNTIENLQRGNEAVALQALPGIVEGLEWVLEAISGLKAIGQLKEVQLVELTKHFQDLVSSLELNDYVLLADILDYEVSPVLNNWLQIISLVEI